MLAENPSPSTSPSSDVKSAKRIDDPLMARIEALLIKGFPWMLFPQPLEQQFLRDAGDARRRHFLISGLLSLFVYNGFLVVDYLMVKDVFDLAVELRLYIFTPIFLALLFIGSRSEWTIVKIVPPVIYEVIVLATGLFAAGSLAFILAETHSPYAHFYHVGFSVVLMYGNIVQRLRFWYAVVFAVAVLGIHFAGVMLLSSFPHRLMFPIMSQVLATALFSLAANYAMERDERKRYLLTLRERGVVRELTRAHQRLKELTHEDSLTGLYNRRHFQEYLSHVWERAQYDNSQVNVMMVDIDHFKKFNDRYGHHAGDECLQQIARALSATLRRPEDAVARYGGEEFVAVLPNTEPGYALQVAERVRQAVEAMQIRHESSSTALVVTVSIGIASCKADFQQKDAILLAAADRALHQAKREGRNRVCVEQVPSPSASRTTA
jgi:diguanylate cyclase (GGDEF)-like protein